MLHQMKWKFFAYQVHQVEAFVYGQELYGHLHSGISIVT